MFLQIVFLRLGRLLPRRRRCRNRQFRLRYPAAAAALLLQMAAATLSSFLRHTRMHCCFTYSRIHLVLYGFKQGTSCSINCQARFLCSFPKARQGQESTVKMITRAYCAHKLFQASFAKSGNNFATLLNGRKIDLSRTAEALIDYPLSSRIAMSTFCNSRHAFSIPLLF